ncbi:MAG: phage virion morphogenesis protein [Rhodospirillaceae bacterium]|nr:MAG: phage virion morphogenesis protein [Rhodospirillaceae bacterium]
MAGAAIQVNLRELEAVSARLERLAARTENMLPLMDDIGAAMVASVQNRFETGRGPDGIAWEKSERVKRAQGNAQTLVDDAHLLGSLTHNAASDSVEVGSNKIYAAIHQFGGRTGRNHAVDMPARPYLGLDAGDEREIGAIVDDYLAEALR